MKEKTEFGYFFIQNTHFYNKIYTMFVCSKFFYEISDRLVIVSS